MTPARRVKHFRPQSSFLDRYVDCNLLTPLLGRFVIGFVQSILPIPPRVQLGPLPLSGLAFDYPSVLRNVNKHYQVAATITGYAGVNSLA